jgi:hypothetical protein
MATFVVERATGLLVPTEMWRKVIWRSLRGTALLRRHNTSGINGGAKEKRDLPAKITPRAVSYSQWSLPSFPSF